jgi:diamine N-acetyltransferase
MKDAPVTIRNATNADAPLLAEIGAKTFYETFAADNTPEDMAAYLAESFRVDKLAVELADPAGCFLIAEAGSATAGYAKLQNGQPPDCVSGYPTIELVRLYVLQAWLGHGVGAALMRACLDEAARLGCETIWLGVWEHNARARAFYRKWGFEQVGSHVFKLGDDLQTDLLMQRSVHLPHKQT